MRIASVTAFIHCHICDGIPCHSNHIYVCGADRNAPTDDASQKTEDASIAHSSSVPPTQNVRETTAVSYQFCYEEGAYFMLLGCLTRISFNLLYILYDQML